MGKGNRLRRKTQDQNSTATYWHGGRAGRAVGDELVPGTVAARRWGHPIYQGGLAFKDYRPDFVYATTDRDLALDFAILHGHAEPAALYRVELNGSVQHDPDFPPGVSFRCLRATVIAVELDGIDAAMPRTNAAYHYQTWDDGAPLYDKNGYALPSKAAQHLGVTAGDLFPLGKYADFPVVNARCSEIVSTRHPKMTVEEVMRVRQMTGGAV